MLITGLLTPVPTPTLPAESAPPGTVGFVAIALLAVAVIVLIWDMLRRVRHVRYRAEVNEELDAEEAALREGDASASGAGEDERS